MGSHPTRAMTKPSTKISTKGKKDIHEGARRTTKGHEARWICFNGTRRSFAARRPPPTASAFAWRLGFCDSPSRGE